MGSHGDGGGMSALAIVCAVRGGDSIEIAPEMVSGPGGLNPVPMTIPGTDVTVALEAMQVESQAIQLSFNDPAHPVQANEILALDVATKPLVNWVWAGVIILTLGSVISFVRRWRETDVDV